MARATITRKIQIMAPPSPGEPLWRQGQAVNAWREIDGSSLSLCPPTVNPGGMTGPSAKLDAWNGLSIDSRSSTVYAAGNGGHGDYLGNEVNCISLDDDEPAWIEFYRSSSGFDTPNSGPRYSDGTPVSIHGYWSQQFIESRNMAMRFGLGGGSTDGGSPDNIDGFDITVGVGNDGWSALEDFPSWIAYTPDTSICKDPTTEDVYCFYANYGVYKWTNATNQVSAVNNGYPPDTMGQAAAVFDPLRSHIFLANDRGAWTFDPSTGVFTGRTLSGPAAAGVMTGQNGIVYEPELDRYLILHIVGANNVAVYVVHPTTFECTVLSTTGGSPPAGTSGAQQPYSKFLYVPKHAGCIWFPLYAENGWFLRTH